MIFMYMITINLKGDIGNQLFQLCTLISHSIQHSKSFIVPYSEELYDDDITYKTYWETLFDNIKPYTSGNGKFKDIEHINKLLLIKHPVYEETSLNYNPIGDTIDNVCLNGCFHSYKYFNNYKEKLMLIFNIAHKQLLIRSEYIEFFDKYNIASMHFITENELNVNPILGEDYYDKALSLIPDDYRVLVFSDKKCRERAETILGNLKTKHKHEFVYINDEIEDWKQMLLMSLCRVNIIANNTFSWWGAYLNKDTDKVYYPPLWFGNDSNYNTDDLFLPEWKMIKL
jgi:hypothetical protein